MKNTEEVREAIVPGVGSYGFAILIGLNRQEKHVYQGTVPPATVAARRKKNRAARAARKANR